MCAGGDEFREQLLRVVAERSATPEGRASLERGLREALAVVSGEPCSPACPVVAREAGRLRSDPAVANALREIAEALGLAADHAAFLARNAERLIAAPLPEPA